MFSGDGSRSAVAASCGDVCAAISECGKALTHAINAPYDQGIKHVQGSDKTGYASKRGV